MGATCRNFKKCYKFSHQNDWVTGHSMEVTKPKCYKFSLQSDWVTGHSMEVTKTKCYKFSLQSDWVTGHSMEVTKPKCYKFSLQNDWVTGHSMEVTKPKYPHVFLYSTNLHQELWRITKQKPIEIQIKRRKWNWIGHTLRKEAGSNRENCNGLESSGI